MLDEICWKRKMRRILPGIFWEILEQSTCWRSLRTFPFSTNRSSNLNGNIRSKTLHEFVYLLDEICWKRKMRRILSGIFWEILEQSTCWRSLRTFPFSTNRSSNLNGNIRSETLKMNLSICWMKFVEKERWGVILSGMFWEILEQSTCWRSLRTSASWILRMLNGLRKRHDMLRVKNCPASKGSRNVTILASMKNGRRLFDDDEDDVTGSSADANGRRHPFCSLRSPRESGMCGEHR